MGIDTNYQLLILLTYLAFAIAFWSYHRDHRSRFLLYLSFAWMLQAIRASVELADSLRLAVPDSVNLVSEASYVLVVCLLFLTVMDFLELRPYTSQLWTGASVTILGFLILRSPECRGWLSQLANDSIQVEQFATIGSRIILYFTTGLLLLALGGILLRKAHSGAAFFLGGCFTINGLLRIASPIESYLGHSPFDWILEEFTLSLAYSVGFLLLVATRERDSRAKAEIKLRKSQLSTMNYTRDFPGMAYRCLIDPYRTMKFLSPGVQKFTGYLQDELVENSVISFAHVIDSADRNRVLDQIRERAREGALLELIYQIQTATGSVKWAWEQGRVIADETGRPRYLEGFISDITRLRETEMALEKANRELLKTVDMLERRAKEIDLLNKFGEILQACDSEADAVEILERLAPQLLPDFVGALFLVAPKRKVIRLEASWNGFDIKERNFNPTTCKGLKPQHPLEAKASEALCQGCETHPAGRNGHICATLQTRGDVLGLLQISAKPGLSIHAHDLPSVKRLMIAIAESFSLGISNIRLRESLRAQAILDPLTGLYNRRYFKDSLHRELGRAERKNSTVGLIVLDLDYFKRFNDNFGHAAGDQVLREIGSYLKRSLRGEDIVCRYGGEEFVVILPDIDLVECRLRAEELRQGISRLQIRYSDREVGPITASIGVSVFPTYADTRESLFEGADQALYKAKRTGRNRIVTVAGLESPFVGRES